MKSTASGPSPSRRAIREDLLSGPLTEIENVRLAGVRCASCAEVSLGLASVCPNCGGAAVEALALGDRGVLWTYTVVRHKPPGDYRGPDPFEPFALGLVELADGLRVLSPLTCDLDDLKIGLDLVFHPYVRADPDGDEVVCFSFKPASAEALHV